MYENVISHNDRYNNLCTGCDYRTNRKFVEQSYTNVMNCQNLNFEKYIFHPDCKLRNHIFYSFELYQDGCYVRVLVNDDYVLCGIGRQRAKCGFYQTVIYEFGVCDIHLYVISPVYVTGFLLSKYIPQYDLAYCSNGYNDL